MTAIRVGMLQWQVRPCAGLDAWVARLEREVAEAADHGANLLLLPEYAPLEMAAGTRPDARRELRAAIELAAPAVEAAREVAWRHRVWLLPGTLPIEHGGRIVNTAPLIAPDGRVAVQEKRVMTRFEAESWGVAPGAPPRVFDTDWGRIGIAICYDVEFPPLVRAQAEEEGLDLIFRAAGFDWREPGCSMCLGMNPDRLAPGERCASTSNRNFEGRQGRGGRTHLMSPAMAAAAAIAGHIADVRDYL